jgi:hypothetical protein
MRRREFIAGLGGATAWPLAAQAQQPSLPVVGYLHAGAPEGSGALLTAFRKGLREAGYIEGSNVAIEYRWALNEYSRLLQTPGFYTGRLLKGEKPADLPVVRPARFEFVINLKTAKALGLTIPETLLATADEVIQ